MNKRAFDLEIRRRVEKEEFVMNPKIEEALRQTIRNPHVRQEAARVSRRSLALAFALALAVCGAALALTSLTPKADRTSTPIGQEQASLSPVITASPMPQTTDLPFANGETFEVVHSRTKWEYHVALTNTESEALFAQWTALPDALLTGNLEIVSPRGCARLAPNESLTDTAIGYEFESTYENTAKMGLMVQYYTPTAEVFELDGADAQAAEEAFAQGKLLVKEGYATLPDSYAQAHPDETPVAYYVSQGMLNESSRTTQSVEVPLQFEQELYGDAEPLAQAAGSGFTARVLCAERLYTSPYIVVDLLFDTQALRDDFAKEHEMLVWQLASNGSSRAIQRGLENPRRIAWAGRLWSNEEGSHLIYVYLADRVCIDEQAPLEMIAWERDQVLLNGMSIPLTQAQPINVDGYAFPVHADIDAVFPQLMRLQLQADDIDAADALAKLDTFGESAGRMHYEPGEQSKGFFKVSTEASISPPYEVCDIPYDERWPVVPDAALDGLIAQCREYLSAVGVDAASVRYACYALPQSTAYGDVALTCVSSKTARNADERYVAIRFLLELNGLPLPEGMIGGGDGDIDAFVLDANYADFVFDGEQALCHCTFHKRKIVSEEALEGAPIDWKEAAEIAVKKRIDLMNAYAEENGGGFGARYAEYAPTITRIATIWLTDYDNTIHPGWEIELRDVSRTDGTVYNPDGNSSAPTWHCYVDALTGETRV